MVPSDTTRSNVAASNGRCSALQHTSGGSFNSTSADGQYFLLDWDNQLHIWDRKNNVIYSGTIPHSALDDQGNRAGITPDGNYVLHDGADRYSYRIDHTAQTLSTSGVMFWNASDDRHGSLSTALDGKNYLILLETDYHYAVMAIDITKNEAGRSFDQQIADNRTLYTPGFYGSIDDYHFSSVARGTMLPS